MRDKYCVIEHRNGNNGTRANHGSIGVEKKGDRVLLALDQTEIFYKSTELERYVSGKKDENERMTIVHTKYYVIVLSTI